MTTTPPAPHALPAAPRRARGLRGLTWSVLATHRGGLWCWLAFFAGVSALFLWLYTLEVDTGYHGPCSTDPGGRYPLCGRSMFPQDDSMLFDHVMEPLAWTLSYLPLVVAPFVGGALVARDLEQRTAELAWSQSVTPARWLAAKLGCAVLLLGGGTALVTVLYRWVWLTGARVDVENWYFTEIFRMSGPVTLGYVLLGVGVGAFAGVLIRRVLPVVGLSFGAMLVVQLTADENRFSLWPMEQWSGRQATQIPGGVAPLHLVETALALAPAAVLTAAAFGLLRRRLP